MNTEETLTSLRHRITSMNSVPLDKVTVPVAELAVALQEIERLQTELSEVKADAERYRWLRDQATDYEYDMAGGVRGAGMDANLDAIDAAREVQP